MCVSYDIIKMFKNEYFINYLTYYNFQKIHTQIIPSGNKYGLICILSSRKSFGWAFLFMQKFIELHDSKMHRS